MIKKDSRIEEPPPKRNRIIWRYISFEKFLDLILTSEMFFTNLTRLTDKYEGTMFESNFQLAMNSAKKYDDYYQVKKEILEEQVEINNLRNYTLVNCWTLKRHESFALWKIYVGSGPGIAVRTTVSNLINSINSTKQDFDEDISIATVKYQDTLKYTFSRIEASITKKPFYDFEDEMRLLIFNFPLSDNGYEVPYDMTIGRKVKVNINKLITQLYISPFVNHFYRKTLIDTIVKLAPFLKSRIKESDIRDQ
jgi:hypothetical protein